MIEMELWPAALLMLLGEKPRTMRELCVEVLEQDPGEGYLPTPDGASPFVPLNRVRQAMELWGLWQPDVDDAGRTVYRITKCGERALLALHERGPAFAVAYLAQPEWLVSMRQRQAQRRSAA